MTITDATTIRHLNAYAFLNPFKDPVSLLVPDKEDTYLIKSVNQEIPLHLRNPVLRVILVALTYIAITATFFGLFLLREAASTDVSDYSRAVKVANGKDVARKQARLESALAKLGNQDTSPVESERDEETIPSDLDSDESSNWGSPPITSSDESSASDNDMPSLPITRAQVPVKERRKRVYRHHKRAENTGFSSPESWRHPGNIRSNSTDILEQAIKHSLPAIGSETEDDSDWASPPLSPKSKDENKLNYSPVTTTDDELEMSYSHSEEDSADDNDMLPLQRSKTEDDSDWELPPKTPRFKDGTNPPDFRVNTPPFIHPTEIMSF